MGIFIISCLAFFITAYLLGIAIQAIRIERTVCDIARYVEHKIGRMFQGEGRV